MDRSEEFRKTKPIAEATVTAMLRHGVPPTPSNYMLWYAHVAGTVPELSRTIEILVSNNQEFTPARNEELFQRFFGNDGALAAMQRTGDQLQQSVARVLQHIAAAGGEA